MHNLPLIVISAIHPHQMTTSAKSKLDQTRAAKEGGVYNIWYNRMSMVDRGAA